MPLKTITLKSLAKYLELVEKLQDKKNGVCWFRGIGNCNYSLIPSLFRHPDVQQINDLINLEYDLLTRFRQRSLPFHSKSLEDDWEALFFMQHYGVPTRLLDWTENPFMAFYFAVMDAIPNKNAASIWILDPITWNRNALKHVSYDKGIFSTNDPLISNYKPTNKFTGMQELPVAVYGTHNSPRIVAQRGVFTIFGQNTSPLEEIYINAKFPKDSLIKILIEPDSVQNLKKSILQVGITESVVFPDLDGLAKEIKRHYNFEG